MVVPHSAPPGDAVLLTWCDIAPEEEDDFNEWYNREHMRDRVVALPGFLRGRRFVAIDGAPKYLAIYEARDAAVLRSDAYLSIINQPDPRSRHFILRFQNTIRTIGRMSVSIGEGEGAAIAVLPYSPKPGTERDLRDVLANQIMPQIHSERGIIAVSLIERDAEALAASRSRHARQGDRMLDRALIIEAADASALAGIAQALAEHDRFKGVATVETPSLLRLVYRVSPARGA